MLSSHFEAKQYETFKTRVLLSLLFSILATTVGLLFKQSWGQLIAIILGFLLIFWFKTKAHEYIVWAFIENKEKQALQSYLKPIKDIKKASYSFVVTVFTALLVWLLYQVLYRLPVMPLIKIIIFMGALLLCDALSHIFWFQYQAELGLMNNIKRTLQLLFSKNITILKVAVRLLKPLLLGTIITFIAVVFLNSDAILAAMALPEPKASMMINDILSQNKSQIIRSIGLTFTLYFVYLSSSFYYLNQLKRKPS